MWTPRINARVVAMVAADCWVSAEGEPRRVPRDISTPRGSCSCNTPNFSFHEENTSNLSLEIDDHT